MARLMAKVITCIDLRRHDISQTSQLCNWLSSHASRWTTFVANRVGEIQKISNIQDWFKVESKLNPADIVSRGLYPTDLSNATLWWEGTDFIGIQ